MFLDGRAGHGAVGAVHAAIAGQRLEYRVAAGAFVEPLAGVGRHLLGLRVLADGAGEHGGQGDGLGRGHGQ